MLAVVFAALFWALYALAILTPAGQQWDAASLGTFWWLRGEEWLAIYGIRDWLVFGLLALAVVAGVESAIKRRWTAVVAAGTLVALSGLGGYALKLALLPRPYLGEFAYTYQTFPSGHTAVALAASVAVAWFAPRWLRPTVVLILGVSVVVVGLTSLLSYAHRASDVIGGVLLAGAIGFAIAAVAGRGRSIHSASVGWTIAGAIAIVAGVVVLAASVVRAGGDSDIAALGIATVLALCGTTTVVLASQRQVSG